MNAMMGRKEIGEGGGILLQELGFNEYKNIMLGEQKRKDQRDFGIRFVQGIDGGDVLQVAFGSLVEAPNIECCHSNLGRLIEQRAHKDQSIVIYCIRNLFGGSLERRSLY